MDTMTVFLCLGLLLLGTALGYFIGSLRAASRYGKDLAAARTAEELLSKRTATLESEAQLATELTAAVGPLAAGVRNLENRVHASEETRAEYLSRLDTNIQYLLARNA